MHLPSLEDWGKQMKEKVLRVEFAGQSDDKPTSAEARNLPTSQEPASGELPSGATDTSQQQQIKYVTKTN